MNKGKIDNCTLREATYQDAKMLLDWRNDPETRAASFDTREIRFEDHMRWYEKALADPSALMYIMEDDGEAVGQIRLNVEVEDTDGKWNSYSNEVRDSSKTRARISYSVAPGFRGRGYGSKLLALVEEQAKLDARTSTLYGEVRTDNIASQKAFLKNGYLETIGPEENTYTKQI